MRNEEFRILVIDNGSRDGSVKYLSEKFPQVQVTGQERNVGFAAACNVGMRIALDEGAKYILLVNNDTEVDSGLLKELLREAESNTTVGMVSPKILYFDFRDRIWWAGGRYSQWQGVPRHIGRNERDGGQYDRPINLDWATGCVLLIRCSALRQVGLFDERMFGNGEDLDLSLRMRKGAWQIRFAPQARLWHKEGFDYRKNAGEHVRAFTAARNLPWVVKKHADPVHRFTFWCYFIAWHLPTLALQCLLRGDVRSALAILAGVNAYFQMCADPECSALPKELLRSTLVERGRGDTDTGLAVEDW